MKGGARRNFSDAQSFIWNIRVRIDGSWLSADAYGEEATVNEARIFGRIRIMTLRMRCART